MHVSLGEVVVCTCYTRGSGGVCKCFIRGGGVFH